MQDIQNYMYTCHCLQKCKCLLSHLPECKVKDAEFADKQKVGQLCICVWCSICAEKCNSISIEKRNRISA